MVVLLKVLRNPLTQKIAAAVALAVVKIWARLRTPRRGPMTRGRNLEEDPGR